MERSRRARRTVACAVPGAQRVSRARRAAGDLEPLSAHTWRASQAPTARVQAADEPRRLAVQLYHQVVQLVVVERIRVACCELVDRRAKPVEHQFDDTNQVRQESTDAPGFLPPSSINAWRRKTSVGGSPLSIADTVDLFDAAPFRWWISGCRALELHVRRSWRDHEDTDVGMVRQDVVGLAAVLDGWDIHVAAAGQLSPWSGAPLDAALHQNNLWCRRYPGGPWQLDVTIGEGDEETWMYRRDPSVRVPWPDAVLHTSDGIPYLAPELQLLFKSKAPRPKDDVDAREVIPAARRSAKEKPQPAPSCRASVARAPCQLGC